MPARTKHKKEIPVQSKDAKSALKPSQTPQWPPLSPLPDLEDLTLHPLLPDQVLTISSLFTSSLAKKYISFLSTLPLTTTPGQPKRGDAVRVNDRFQTTDAAFAHALWTQTGLSTLLSNPTINNSPLTAEQTTALWGGDLLGLNPNIRIYRYTPGQFFDKHYDESNNLLFPVEIPKSDPDDSATGTKTISVPAKTTWTLLLYLSSPVTGCEGGETVFYPERVKKAKGPEPEPVVAELEVGMALLHRHGGECLLHEGREVKRGEKWVIRSDVCVRR